MQGLLGVTLSAGVPALHGLHAAVNQSAFFVAMLYIVAIGTGAAPRCMSSCMTSSAAARVKGKTCTISHAALHLRCYLQGLGCRGCCSYAFHLVGNYVLPHAMNSSCRRTHLRHQNHDDGPTLGT